MRDEAVGRLAIVLVALEQDCAVLDHQQPGDALVARKSSSVQFWFSNRYSSFVSPPAARKRQRRFGFAQPVVWKDLVDMAERSNPHAFIEEPVGAGADRIALVLAEQLLVGCGKGRDCQSGKEACKEISRKNSSLLHWLTPARGSNAIAFSPEIIEQHCTSWRWRLVEPVTASRPALASGCVRFRAN